MDIVTGDCTKFNASTVAITLDNYNICLSTYIVLALFLL